MAAQERPFRIYADVEMVLQFLAIAQQRAERAVGDLRETKAEAYAIEAVERALAEIVETTERLRRDGLRLDRAAELVA